MQQSKISIQHSVGSAYPAAISELPATSRVESNRKMTDLQAVPSDVKIQSDSSNRLKGFNTLSTNNSEHCESIAGSGENQNDFQRSMLDKTVAIGNKSKGINKMSKKFTSGLSSISNGIAGNFMNCLAKASALAVVVVLSAGMYASDAFGQDGINKLTIEPKSGSESVVEAESATADFTVTAVADPGNDYRVMYYATEQGSFIDMTETLGTQQTPTYKEIDFAESGGGYSGTLQIAIDNDMLGEKTGEITVTLVPRAGYYELATGMDPKSMASLTVYDDDAPELTIRAVGDKLDGYVSEHKKFAEFEIESKTVMKKQFVEVHYTPSNTTGTYLSSASTPRQDVATSRIVDFGNPVTKRGRFYVPFTNNDGEGENGVISVSLRDDKVATDAGSVQNPVFDDANYTLAGDSITAQATIVDDERPGFMIFDAKVMEGDSNSKIMVFKVELSPVRSTPTTVNVSTGSDSDSGTADATPFDSANSQAPYDYVPITNQILTFPPNQSEQTVTVEVRGDTAREGDEVFTVSLSNPTPASGINLNKDVAIGIIENDDQTTVSIADPAADTNEGDSGDSASEMEFTVSLSGPSDEQVTVEWELVAGAEGGTAECCTSIPVGTQKDFHISTESAKTDGVVNATGMSGTLTFTPGTVDQKITAVITVDDAHELDETVIIRLKNPTSAEVSSSANTATGTIVDDDTVNLSITLMNSGDSPVDEGRTLTFNVTLSNESTNEISVEILAFGGNNPAILGQDYTLDKREVTFPLDSVTGVTQANQLTQQVVATILDDQLVEHGRESFFLQLINPTGNAALDGTLFRVEAEIENSDTSLLSLNTAAIKVNEGDANTGEGYGSEIVFHIEATTAFGANLEVTYEIVDSATTATVGTDFRRARAGIIAAGETDGTITLPIIGDNILEGDETVGVRLTGARLAGTELSNIIDMSNNSHAGTIADDDDKPTVTIADAMITEGTSSTDTKMKFKISLNKPHTEDITVNWMTETTGGDTASFNDQVYPDYTAVSSTPAMITASKTDVEIEVAVKADMLDEQNETFTVKLVGTSEVVSLETAPQQQLDMAKAYLGTKTEATGTIVDDDTVKISIEAPSGNNSGSEGDANTESFMTFTIRLSTVADRDVTFKVSTLDRDSGTTATAGASAASENVDYISKSGVLAETKTIQAEESSKIFQVRIIGDDRLENDEILKVGLSDIMIGDEVLTTDSITANGIIVDDDQVIVRVFAPDPVREEDSGSEKMQFKLALSKPPSQPFTLIYHTSNTSGPRAANDKPTINGQTQVVDFVGKGTSVPVTERRIQFAPGASVSHLIDIEINDDDLDEVDETVTLTLLPHGIDNRTAVISDVYNSATGIILDDDDFEVKLSVFRGARSVTTASVNESAGRLTLLIQHTGLSDRRVDLDWEIVSETATRDVDFTAILGAPGLMHFRPLYQASPGTLPVHIDIVNDNFDEENETFKLKIIPTYVGEGNSNDIISNPVTVTIVDDESFPDLTISAEAGGLPVSDPVTNGISVAEGATAEVTVAVDGTQTGIVSFNWSTEESIAANSATMGARVEDNADFLAVSDMTENIAMGASPREANIRLDTSRIFDDMIQEPSETFNLVISNPVNAKFPGRAERIVIPITITDNDTFPATVEPAETEITVTEGTPFDLPLTATGLSGSDAAVTWTVMSHDAGLRPAIAGDSVFVPGADFVTMTRELPIPASSGAATIAIDSNVVVDDGNSEPNETFLIVLSHAKGVRFAGNVQTIPIVVTIMDDDQTLPTIGFGAPGSTSYPLSFEEGESSLSVALNLDRNAPADREVTVNWNLVEDLEGGNPAIGGPTFDTNHRDYISDTDFMATSGTGRTATILRNRNEGSFDIDISSLIRDDTDQERDETFLIELTNPNNARFANDADSITLSVTITDSDAITVSFADAGTPFAASETETGNTASVTGLKVQLSGKTYRPVSVYFSTEDGKEDAASLLANAVALDDYETVSNVLVTVDEGEITADIPLTINNDDLDENRETFSVKLVNSVNATISSAGNSRMVVINDSDASPTLTVSDSTVQLDEGEEIEITVTLDSVSGRDVTVEYFTAEITAGGGKVKATPGVDFNEITEGSMRVTIPAGETEGTVAISAKKDNVVEFQSEYFNVVFDNAVNATIERTETEIKIDDIDKDDMQIIVGESLSVVEGTGNLVTGETNVYVYEIPISLNVIVGASNIHVEYVTVVGEGTATPDKVYNPSTRMDEANTILPHDFGQIVIDQLEFDVGQNTPKVRAVPGAGMTANAVIRIYDDSENESLEETFDVKFTLVSRGSGVAEVTRTITIVDNDNPTVASDQVKMTYDTSNVIRINEGEGNGDVKFNLLLSSQADSQADEITFDYEIVHDGSTSAATANEDFLALSGKVTIDDMPDGTARDLTSPASYEVLLKNVIRDDSDMENDETFNVRIFNSSSNAVFETTTGGQSPTLVREFNVAVTIADDRDPVVVSVSGMSVVSEADGMVEIAVELSGTSTSDVTLDWYTDVITDRPNDIDQATGRTQAQHDADTANGGLDVADYISMGSSGSPMELPIATGSKSGRITVDLINDTKHERYETFRVNLALPDTGSAVFFPGANIDRNRQMLTFIATIESEDGLPQFIFSAPQSVDEDAGSIDVSVSLTGTSFEPISLQYSTVAGTDANTVYAVENVDFTPVTNGNLNFAAGEFEKTATVAILDNNRIEPDRAVVVDFTNPTNAELPASYSPVTVNIIDDDIPSVSTADSDRMILVNEGQDSEAELELIISDTSVDPITLTVVTIEGTAKENSDYTPLTVSERNITTSSQTAIFRIPIVDDSVRDEPQETFTVRLTVSSNAELDRPETDGNGNPRTDQNGKEYIEFTIVIYDTSPIPRVSVDAVSSSIVEGSPAEFTITASGALPNSAVISYSVTQDGNFVAFAPSSPVSLDSTSTATVSIATADDADEETDGSITLTLADVAEGAGYELHLDLDRRSDTVTVMDNDGEGGEGDPIYSVAGLVIVDILKQQQSGEPKTWNSGAVRHVVSISAEQETVNEGSPIRIVIRVSPEAGRNMTIRVALSQVGDFLHSTNPVSVPVKEGESSTTAEILTVDDTLAENNGMVTATVQESEDYVLGEKSSVSVAVLDHADRDARTGQVALGNEAVLPEIAGAIGARTLGAMSFRVEQAFSARSGYSLELGGQSSVESMLQAGGKALNSDSLSMREVLGDSSFSLDLFPETSGASTATVWGLGDFRSVSGSNRIETKNFDGDVFTGHIGFDTMLGEGVVTGVTASMMDGELDYGAGNQSIRYETQSTGLHPYIGLRSASGENRLEVTAGYGLGEVMLDQERYEAERLQSSFHNIGVSGIGRLYSTDQLISGGTSIMSIAGDSWLARHFMKNEGGFIQGSETHASYVRVIMKGSHDQTLADGSSVNPTASVGLRADGRSTRSFLGMELGSGLSFKTPFGLSIEGSSTMLMEEGSQVRELGVKSSMDYDHGSDGYGVMLSLDPSWGRKKPGEDNTLWSNSLLSADRYAVSNHNGTALKSEIGYGIRIWDDAGLLTPFTGMDTSEEKDVFKFGSRLSHGRDVSFALQGNRTVQEEEANGYDVRLNGSFKW